MKSWRNEFFIGSILCLLIIVGTAIYLWRPILWSLVVVVPLIAIGMYDMFQSKHAIMRNYPILGRGRYVMEELRPKIYQYFIESDTNGRPISRMMRSIVYQRAKQELDTTPFGTLLDQYEPGYEWMNHSIAALNPEEIDHHPRVIVGGPHCTKPYSASLLNVSAMSYGALSKHAIMALNGGAKNGHFAHNTGEGGISPYHLKPGGDLIYQIGTGYFGCRASDGNFDPGLYQERLEYEQVKMTELKLSQGAKPGHGGILPAKKVTAEIAGIRNVPLDQDVISPPYHKAFNSPIGLLEFIHEMRSLGGGKPVGFKLCIGKRDEFFALCKAMVETGMYPDFISVDGGEGGTGAAPLEFTNSVGTPFLDGLAFCIDALNGFDLKKNISVFASGKIITGFHIFRALALGADACNSARAMMFALGCIQALECNTNTCPTGVATQDPELVAGLKVGDKSERVYQYHKETVGGFVELMAATGIKLPSDISRDAVFRRISSTEIRSFDEIYPHVEVGSLLNFGDVPDRFRRAWKKSTAESF